ncbi:3-demethylubiquinone-9 3-methyltransferase [Sorangium cellulosum]|uniref:3-demethylubiquinone-9 3-methyltransferase n=1 Tax=Sorangium cellulosum TaxID=56 RepID=A0A4P2Q8Y0_SORCE|nr:VOC family protein [Sorangium cellulosum]AUX25648.1 3-demethylubiquinone-9 3-methyltransferase [Sorangium cellulosum]
MTTPQKIKTCLWFGSNAEEAVRCYLSVFRRSRLLEELRAGDGGPGPKGSLVLAEFEIDGQRFVALNGAPQLKFTEAISLIVTCEAQEEIDELWSKLTADGGSEGQCGWLKDRFGVSWQIVPSALPRLLGHPEPARAARVMQAMMQIKKLDIARLEDAAR